MTNQTTPRAAKTQQRQRTRNPERNRGKRHARVRLNRQRQDRHRGCVSLSLAGITSSRARRPRNLRFRRSSGRKKNPGRTSLKAAGGRNLSVTREGRRPSQTMLINLSGGGRGGLLPNFRFPAATRAPRPNLHRRMEKFVADRSRMLDAARCSETRLVEV